METKKDKEVQFYESKVIINKVAVDNSITKNNVENWKKVIVDGIEGIVFGCADALIENTVSDDIISCHDASGVNGSVTFLSVNNDSHIIVDDCMQVAKTVDKTSFSEAFVKAREQVGIGGVFVWCGKMYGTFNAEEWDNLTIEQRDEYTSHINYYDDLTNNTTIQESEFNEYNYEENDFDAEDDIDLNFDSDVEIIFVEENNDVQIVAINDSERYDCINADDELHSNEEGVLIIAENNDVAYFSADDNFLMMGLDQDYHIINNGILDSNVDSCDIA